MNQLVVIRSFRGTPPQDLQQLMVSKAGEFYGVDKPRFMGNDLVADRAPGFSTQAGEKLRYILEGLADGYRLRMGPCRPHGVDYWMLHRGKWKRVVEWFGTFDEAVNKRMAVREQYLRHLEAYGEEKPEEVIDPTQVYDETKSFHF